MTIADIGSIASATISLFALLIAAFSMHKSNKFGATANRLNQILIEREESESIISKKPDLSANIFKTGKNNYRLKIFNRGQGVARNIRLIDLSTNNSALAYSSINSKFPIPILEKHQSVELPLFFHLQSRLGCHIKLKWDDDIGIDQEKELTPMI